ncbi:Bgt-55112 [Blumeria graminis f. sp. tritici]|uniref:Bgt-55112 n=1 Tax=Blumeria graminis f. sp. tritici TaxID=62690 RepID=A0A9X9QBX0_BLUGR|nr:Bgt-55112 [Blumeria graminis f. sp. tritici]
MMQRKDITSMGVKFWILARVLRVELCVRQDFACESAADTINTSQRWEVLRSAAWWCSLV